MEAKYIDDTVRFGKDCSFGYNTIILEKVKLGSNCQIGNNVVIHPGTIIGDNVRIDDNTVIGKQPMKAAISVTTSDQQLPPCSIDSYCIIGANAVIYRGCEIGRKVLIADLATVRENVSIGKCTIVGRGVAIENFCTIGKYTS